MNITRVIFNTEACKSKAIADCEVVFDDCFKVAGICMYKKEDGSYYLTFPSKQDIYREVEELNEKGIVTPKNRRKERGGNGKEYEEFFYPVDSLFYDYLLSVLVAGLESCPKGRARVIYRPI